MDSVDAAHRTGTSLALKKVLTVANQRYDFREFVRKSQEYAKMACVRRHAAQIRPQEAYGLSNIAQMADFKSPAWSIMHTTDWCHRRLPVRYAPAETEQHENMGTANIFS
jgi:hypothetical protein